MIIETASHYSTINSSAFVVQFVPFNVDKPILSIIMKDENEPVPTNVAKLKEMINNQGAGFVHCFEGAKEVNNESFDSVLDLEL